MEALRFDRLLEAITSTEVVVGALWVGLAALSVALLLLARTRWGQSQPLRKCMVLSLLAHLLMVGYATTVRIVASAPLDANEATVHISIGEEDYEFDELAQPAAVEKPWESFGAPSSAELSPNELARAEFAELDERAGLDAL